MVEFHLRDTSEMDLCINCLRFALVCTATPNLRVFPGNCLCISEVFLISLKVKRYISPYNRLWWHRGGLQVQLYSFFNLRAKWRWVFNSTPRPLYSREWPVVHCIVDWVCPRACLDRCGKAFPYWNSIPGPSTPLWVATRTALFRPLILYA